MAGQYDHRERAKELIAAVTADPHRDLELTALAAVAEAALTVADELAGLRRLLGYGSFLPPKVRSHLPTDVRRSPRSS